MLFFNIKNKNNSGFTIVEVIVASAIITLAMIALMQTAEKSVILSNSSLTKSQASLLLEEGAEAVKSIRDSNWSNINNLSLNTPYKLFFNTSSNTWILDNSGSGSISGDIPNYPIDSIFNRSVTFYEVERDSNDDIVENGGTVDPKTKKVTITVSWSSPSGEMNKILSFYISDIFD